MDIKVIGTNIARLRKEKGVTQEELARHVNISGQAVSKWENGGVPDAELLPQIADFFEVSVDALFGRNIADYSDIETALAQKIIDLPKEERMKEALEICWVMQRAIYGKTPKESGTGSVKEIQDESALDGQRIYSGIFYDSGYTLMGLNHEAPFFYLAPEPADIKRAYFEGMDYPALFAMLSDKVIFDSILFLHTRQSLKPFTPKLFVDNLGMTSEKAQEVIATLLKHDMLGTMEIELDDGVQIVYTNGDSYLTSFIAMLMFARQMVIRPKHWRYLIGGRKTPYLS